MRVQNVQHIIAFGEMMRVQNVQHIIAFGVMMRVQNVPHIIAFGVMMGLQNVGAFKQTHQNPVKRVSWTHFSLLQLYCCGRVALGLWSRTNI